MVNCKWEMVNDVESISGIRRIKSSKVQTMNVSSFGCGDFQNRHKKKKRD
jgi:hypothetical protein